MPAVCSAKVITKIYQNLKKKKWQLSLAKVKIIINFSPLTSIPSGPVVKLFGFRPNYSKSAHTQYR